MRSDHSRSRHHCHTSDRSCQWPAWHNLRCHDEQKHSRNLLSTVHALDLTTGVEEFGGPVDIVATYPGTGDNSSNGNVVFNPSQYFERAGLALSNGVVYTTWTSHGDCRPYTSWVIGYDEHSLAQVRVLKDR